ncbi:MAG TPA: methylated-DNA--[protein]-cysteine S-methyltransferase [Actinomycetota bacterium]|nr:methylated-DNA--[protein]-cysteine S-methyltransferase [Actinomycetota bacterium]
MTAVRHRTLSTPIGTLTIVCSDRGVVATIFDDDGRDLELARIERWFGQRPAATGVGSGATAIAATAQREARGYFAGRIHELSVPPDLSLVGEGFGRRVLEVVATIPFGELWTYGDVAGMAGSPRAARAAGSALAACPIELFVPCHRVVHAGGTIGGYGRHDDRKRWLLRHEGSVP